MPEQGLQLHIDPETTYQPIEGFGASGCWWAQWLGEWPDETLEPVIDLLYNTQTGIGLTQYRYTIGAGGGEEIPDRWRRSECYEVAPGVYDWSRDAAARRVLDMVCRKGVGQVIAFSISPTVRMTRSGYASGALDGGSNLRPEALADFARFLVEVVQELRRQGYPVTHLSPLNEPHWDWQPSKGQEGCHLEVGECVEVVRAVLGQLEQEGIDIELSAIEAHDWHSAHLYADALMAEPYIAERLKNYAVHSYWSDAPAKEAFAGHVAAHYPQLKLWMGEWCEMVRGRDVGMDSALCLATTLHDDLTLGGVSAWQYWIAVSKHDFRDGLIYVDEKTQSHTQTKRLWALGNYSRFIAPQSRRVALTGSGALKASAYLSPDARQLTVVVVNTADTAVAATLEVPAEFTVARRFETSSEHDLEPVEEGLPDRVLTFPPQSVNTVVVQKAPRV